jgi:hypothetical protein
MSCTVSKSSESESKSVSYVSLDLSRFVDTFHTRVFSFIGASYLNRRQCVFECATQETASLAAQETASLDEKEAKIQEARYQSLLMNEFPNNIQHVYYYENGNDNQPHAVLGKMGHYYFYFQAPYTSDGKMSGRHPIKCYMSRRMYDPNDKTSLAVPVAFFKRADKYQAILSGIDPTLDIARYWRRLCMKGH